VSSDAIEIQSRADGTFVPATLLGGMAATDLLVVENEWRSERSQIMQQLLAAGVPRVQWPQSLHWDWSKKDRTARDIDKRIAKILKDLDDPEPRDRPFHSSLA
jgi:hypothetical protein